MPVPAAAVPITLDVTTLFVVATCVTGLLGILLLVAFARNRVPALAWGGAAYLVGGFSVAVWSLERSLPLPVGIGNAMLFIACGMMWNAARVFHGRPVLKSALIGGAGIWLFACAFMDFAAWPTARFALASAIIAGYTCATAAELSREPRRRFRRRWPALFVPMLHGAVFLFPLPLASVLPGEERATLLLSSGWMALFVLEMMLYAVGTAFIVLVLANERTMRIHRDAAATDELTGALNRRGVLQAVPLLMAQQARRGELVSALMFDLDHFKSINDRFGHAVGDKALQLFAATAGASTRATDIVGRFGGEEFLAIIPGGPSDAKIVAERVRAAFAAAGVTVADCALNATVSVGAASGPAGTDLVALLGAADAALYRAKANGRNRVEIQTKLVNIPPPSPTAHAADRDHRPPKWADAPARLATGTAVLS